MKKPRFELVRTDAAQPWMARYRAANGPEVWRTSENYTQRRGALNAIRLFTGHAPVDKGHGLEVRVSEFIHPDQLLEVRELDERTPRPDPIPIASMAGVYAGMEVRPW